MLLAVLCGFGAALFAPLGFRRFPLWAGRLAPLLPLGLFLFFLSHIGPVSRGETVVYTTPWIPSLGIDFSLYLDGLGMLFALLVTGIGFLIFLYTPAYLGADRRQGTLFAWLFAFMAAMLGTTLAGNLITLFVFWELTGLCSYLLIGFDHEAENSRSAALQALLVTGGGGLALLAGFLLLGGVVGSMELPVLLASGDLVRNHPLYLPILLLLLGGAFTKSAQFPFHFWLPNAMAAPTPISAYLHSATMVKLGIYLLARFSPVLAGTELWLALVAGVGGLTMLVGGILAVLEHDLKRILAWSTVSALGILTLLFGVGTPTAITAAILLLLTHALYKSSLFLVAGALDHGAGSRDIRQLGGLATQMPWLAAAAILAALAMAGLPPLFGFIAKESIYTALLLAPWEPLLLTGLMLVANALMVTVAVMTGLGPFLGKGASSLPTPHPLPLTLWLAPLLPAALGLLLGLVPGFVAPLLLHPAIAVVQAAPVSTVLALWHGFNFELLLSAATLLVGTLIVLSRRRLLALLPASWQEGGFTQDGGFVLLLRTLLCGARLQTIIVQNGRLRYYLMATIGVAMGSMGLTFLESGGLPGALPWPSGYLHEWLAAGIIVAGALYVTVTDSRLGAVVALGTVGYGVSLVYILYGAPDLAMTQFCIETLAIVLFVLVLYRLPLFALLSTPVARLRDAAMAAAIGGLMTLLMLYVLAQPLVPHVSDFFLANSWPAAHGRNVVNVILVDFRALDTLGEIVVLAVAALGVFGLIQSRRADGEGK
ncbi:MAG: Na(+)/H(+) antiporter subunit A [Deltaproteobacteria bacterium HGW-Deltaproteobacteria-4]|nr:MAG: Na(+)/H(+) antiporter subunit A [Deltaproteobacteria bacterium HGW-Deltaproteobacteria-4]